jgi:hypothetical protein
MVDVSEASIMNHLNKYNIPRYMYGGIVRWIRNGIPPGHFLSNLLKNDLRRTFEKADENNILVIKNYLMFLYNEAPSECWGSEKNFNNWIKQGGSLGLPIKHIDMPEGEDEDVD